MKSKRSGWAHPTANSSRNHLSRRILTGKRRASRIYRLAKRRITEHELDQETR